MVSTRSKPGDHRPKQGLEFLAKHNPFRKKVYEHPGRLFMFEEAESDTEAVRELLQDKAVFVEIGSGSGSHLNELAKQNPDAAAFGFEIRFKRSVRTIEKAKKEEINNSYILRTNGEYIDQIFPPTSVDTIYINFPDPWAKKRQKKNRILQPKFYEKIRPILKANGALSFKTDHEEYFQSILAQLKDCPFFDVIEETSDLYASKYLENNIATEFESLFLSQSLPIHYLKAKLVK